MDANAQYELYLIKKELQDIATELDNIANGVRRDFSGIGNDKCANSISSSAKHYRDVKSQLEKMDLSTLSDEFLAKKQEEERKAAAAQVQRQSAATASAKASSSSQKTSSQNSSSSKSTQTTKTTTSKSSKSMVETVEEGLKNIGNAIKGVFSWFK